MKHTVSLIFVPLAIAMSASAVSAQSRISVKFARGARSATVTGSVRGYTYVDYVLNAREGQTLDVRLTSASDTAEFVVFDPNGENVEGADGVAEYDGVLAMSGNYRVRVLLPRSEARRKDSGTSFTVRFTIR